MTQPTLLVLAAGLGSRYGGLKQLDPVGPGGETLLDFSVHDARRAGFERVVFLIRRDIDAEFREKIGARYAGRLAVDYAYQQVDELPVGLTAPATRTKPWGTAHAVWCARHAIKTPFAAINADDFYGADAFQQLAGFLTSVDAQAQPAGFAMAGYRLDRTLSEHGTVARGLCDIGVDGCLLRVEELTTIARRDDGVIADGASALELPGEATVSMNFWGFTPRVFPLIERELGEFFRRSAMSEKAECYIPSAVAGMIASGSASVRVLPTDAEWFGVTYREDRPRVVESIRRAVAEGDYRDM